jgi:hypothetical protein
MHLLRSSIVLSLVYMPCTKKHALDSSYLLRSTLMMGDKFSCASSVSVDHKHAIDA